MIIYEVTYKHENKKTPAKIQLCVDSIFEIFDMINKTDSWANMISIKEVARYEKD